MSRKATGSIIEPTEERPAWAIRFTAYGKRRFVTLGSSDEGWNREKAEAELGFTLEKIRRGEWQPEEREGGRADQGQETSFHEFAEDWLEVKAPKIAPNTLRGYRTTLELHLLPFFAEHSLGEISRRDVDRFTAHKQREGRLSARSINQALTLLSSILESAIDYELIDSNAAAGRRRRLKAPKPNTPHLEPEQLPALLEAAKELRIEKGYRPENLESEGFESRYRDIARPLLATLALTGMRISEALALEWRDVDLSTRTLTVRKSKTDAGRREIDLTWALAEILGELKAAKNPGRRDPVFASEHHRRADRSKPAPLDRNNVAKRVLAPAIAGANLILEERGMAPIGRVTPHGLRHAFASLRFAQGDDPVYVSAQLGHEDPSFSIRVYAKAVKRREKLTGEALKAFDQARELAAIGSKPSSDSISLEDQLAQEARFPRPDGESGERARQDSNLRPHAPEREPGES